MSHEKNDKKKEPWTARRIVALLGILLLVGLYASTLVFALMDSPTAKGLLMGAVFCTIAVPVLLYAMTVVAKVLRGKGSSPDLPENAPSIEATDSAHSADTSDT